MNSTLIGCCDYDINNIVLIFHLKYKLGIILYHEKNLSHL